MKQSDVRSLEEVSLLDSWIAVSERKGEGRRMIERKLEAMALRRDVML
jgi:hypothetical protein